MSKQILSDGLTHGVLNVLLDVFLGLEGNWHDGNEGQQISDTRGGCEDDGGDDNDRGDEFQENESPT